MVTQRCNETGGKINDCGSKRTVSLSKLEGTKSVGNCTHHGQEILSSDGLREDENFILMHKRESIVRARRSARKHHDRKKRQRKGLFHASKEKRKQRRKGLKNNRRKLYKKKKRDKKRKLYEKKKRDQSDAKNTSSTGQTFLNATKTPATERNSSVSGGSGNSLTGTRNSTSTTNKPASAFAQKVDATAKKLTSFSYRADATAKRLSAEQSRSPGYPPRRRIETLDSPRGFKSAVKSAAKGIRPTKKPPAGRTRHRLSRNSIDTSGRPGHKEQTVRGARSREQEASQAAMDAMTRKVKQDMRRTHSNVDVYKRFGGHVKDSPRGPETHGRQSSFGHNKKATSYRPGDDDKGWDQPAHKSAPGAMDGAAVKKVRSHEPHGPEWPSKHTPGGQQRTHPGHHENYPSSNSKQNVPKRVQADKFGHNPSKKHGKVDLKEGQADKFGHSPSKKHGKVDLKEGQADKFGHNPSKKHGKVDLKEQKKTGSGPKMTSPSSLVGKTPSQTTPSPKQGKKSVAQATPKPTANLKGTKKSSAVKPRATKEPVGTSKPTPSSVPKKSVGASVKPGQAAKAKTSTGKKKTFSDNADVAAKKLAKKERDSPALPRDRPVSELVMDKKKQENFEKSVKVVAGDFLMSGNDFPSSFDAMVNRIAMDLNKSDNGSRTSARSSSGGDRVFIPKGKTITLGLFQTNSLLKTLHPSSSLTSFSASHSVELEAVLRQLRCEVHPPLSLVSTSDQIE